MNKVIAFLRLHRRYLTVIGGVTIFLTFITKEGFRENVKEQLVALEAAQSEYMAAERFTEQKSLIQKLQESITKENSAGKPGRQSEADLIRTTRANLDSLNFEERDNAITLDTTMLGDMILNKKLPSLTAKAKTMNDEADKLNSIAQEFWKKYSTDGRTDRPATADQIAAAKAAEEQSFDPTWRYKLT